MSKDAIEVCEGSGNLFADLGMENADVRQLKSLLAAEPARGEGNCHERARIGRIKCPEGGKPAVEIGRACETCIIDTPMNQRLGLTLA